MTRTHYVLHIRLLCAKKMHMSRSLRCAAFIFAKIGSCNTPVTLFRGQSTILVSLEFANLTEGVPHKFRNYNRKKYAFKYGGLGIQIFPPPSSSPVCQSTALIHQHYLTHFDAIDVNIQRMTVCKHSHEKKAR